MNRPFLAALALMVIGGFLLGRTSEAQSSGEAIDRAISALSLGNVSRKKDEWGTEVAGRLPDGSAIELEFDRHGRLDEIEAVDDGTFPAGSVAAVIPEAVRNHARYPADGRFEKLEFDDDEVEIEGHDSDGMLFEAEFATDGTLIEWHYDD